MTTLVLTRRDIHSLLQMDACIAAVEAAFAADAAGATLPAGVLGTHTAGGGFHVKTAGLTSDGTYYAAKINANFPANPARGLPTIQGVIGLFDATNGAVLALLDSMSVTELRTAAATAVAAKHLAREDGSTVAIAGCGVQGRSQLRALSCVRRVQRVLAYDRDPDASRRFAADMGDELGMTVEAVADFGAAAKSADMIVTCTPSRHAFLRDQDVAPGTFIAAVGADSEDKQELEPALLARGAVVVDVLEQCAKIGELHHAIAAGVMRREDVRATLSEVVGGARRGRSSAEEVTIFDSTGTALEDVAAALLVYRRALAAGTGQTIRLDA